jgi:hypothetical protein
MIGYRVVGIEPAEPSVGEMQLDLLAKPPPLVAENHEGFFNIIDPMLWDKPTASAIGYDVLLAFPLQLMRMLGCTSAWIRSASHSSAARLGPCNETWWRRYSRA